MLYAENSEFRGDPCVDIGKYLEVGIELILPVEIFLKGQGAFLFSWELTLMTKMFYTFMIRTLALVPLGVRIEQVDCFVLELNNLWATTRNSFIYDEFVTSLFSEL